ncbi:MAG: sodium:solute symporter family protein [Negativicutes bacterium]|nr:sodium:solute symporter family protein [Negativicutes bacterium]
MEKLSIIFGMVAAYVLISTLVGVWSVKHTKDTTSFMTAKNKMGPAVVGILMMSEFIGTGSTLGTAQTAYEKGISAAWNLITLGLGYLLYAYFMAPKFQALGEYTISGALAQKYGNGVRLVVSLTMIYALTAVNVSMYTGGAATIASLLQIPITTAVLIIGIATILNVTLGGIRGVGYANLIHTAFKYLGLIVVAWAGWRLIQASPQVTAKIPEMHFSPIGIGLPTLIAWTVANIGAVFSTQYVIQCISSLSSPAEAKKASLVASVTIIPIGFLAAFIGVSAKALFPDIKSVMAMPAFFSVMDPWLAGVAVSGIIAATFVTILACQLGATALIMKDFVAPAINMTEKKKMVLTRVIAVLVGLLPIPFALYVPGLLKTLFFARALRTAVAVVAIFMFYLPQIGSNRSATFGLLCSVAGTTIWFVLGNPWGIDNIYVAAVIPALIMVADRFIYGKRDAGNELQEKTTAGN